ncbi:hypothetical protein FS837_004374 [Tulasnella sp. UAMH 9824]|nr:hypothetical protein FS837_004374 [Tulasnella sp. UAMH 9824]
MALNVRDINIAGNKGNAVYPGIANAKRSSNFHNSLAENFVLDPTTDEKGAGAGPGFRGGRDAKAAMKAGAGVVEARPDIIETTHVAPLQDAAAPRKE